MIHFEKSESWKTNEIVQPRVQQKNRFQEIPIINDASSKISKSDKNNYLSLNIWSMTINIYNNHDFFSEKNSKQRKDKNSRVGQRTDKKSFMSFKYNNIR